MSDASATALATGRARVALPLGELTELHDRVRVEVRRGEAHVRRAIAEILARADELPAIVAAPLVDQHGGSLALEWPLDTSVTVAFSAALPRFQSSLAVHVPELVALAHALAEAATTLAELGVSLQLAPAFLRCPLGAPGGWRWIAVPTMGTSVAEWARASSDSWGWIRGTTLLGGDDAEPEAFAIGAALYTALAGGLHVGVSNSERFRRALCGRVGLPVALDAVLHAALPGSFAGELRALVALIDDLLAPRPPDDWRDRLGELAEQLSPYRTAIRWEYEGRIETARQVLERLAATAPREAVPWEVVARLRRRHHDRRGALAAAIDALDARDRDTVRDLLVELRSTARAQPDTDVIGEAVAAIDRLGGLADLERLHVAHVEARYLGRLEEARTRLAARATARWDEIVRSTMLARLHAAAGEWTHVANACKGTRAAVRAMPNAAGGLGRYVIAYCDYLDGVAHFGAVGQFSDPGYLADAFDRFVSSLDAAHGLGGGEDELVGAGRHWLGWLSTLATRLDVPGASALRAGISAYLAADGGAGAGEIPTGVPLLVWYDEDRLLPLSGVSSPLSGVSS